MTDRREPELPFDDNPYESEGLAGEPGDEDAHHAADTEKDSQAYEIQKLTAQGYLNLSQWIVNLRCAKTHLK